jgi:predicted outer membrane repeat protein
MMRRFAVSILTSFLVAGALVFAISGPASAATITVTSGADSGPGTLRAAVAAAGAGDTIVFSPTLTIVELTSAEIVITQSVSIVGPGADILTVRRSSAGGTPNFRLFKINAPSATVLMSGMTVTNGNQAAGGAVNITDASTVTITDLAFVSNEGDWAGALWQDNATLLIDRSTFAYNTTNGGVACGYCNGGAIITNTGNVIIANSTLSNNQAGDNGGAIKNTTNLTLLNTTIADNSANGFGGGLASYAFESQSLSMKNTLFSGNTSVVRSDQCDNDAAVPLLVNLNNFIADGSCNYVRLTASGSQTSPTGFLQGNPDIAALAANGGSTQTNALPSTSPAAGAGDPSTCSSSPISSVDQRGLIRPSACAIGAFEPVLNPPVTTTSPTTASATPVIPAFTG